MIRATKKRIFVTSLLLCFSMNTFAENRFNVGNSVLCRGYDEVDGKKIYYNIKGKVQAVNSDNELHVEDFSPRHKKTMIHIVNQGSCNLPMVTKATTSKETKNSKIVTLKKLVEKDLPVKEVKLPIKGLELPIQEVELPIKEVEIITKPKILEKVDSAKSIIKLNPFVSPKRKREKYLRKLIKKKEKEKEAILTRYKFLKILILGRNK